MVLAYVAYYLQQVCTHAKEKLENRPECSSA